jgi:hypothetical protein
VLTRMPAYAEQAALPGAEWLGEVSMSEMWTALRRMYPDSAMDVADRVAQKCCFQNYVGSGAHFLILPNWCFRA